MPKGIKNTPLDEDQVKVLPQIKRGHSLQDLEDIINSGDMNPLQRLEARKLLREEKRIEEEQQNQIRLQVHTLKQVEAEEEQKQRAQEYCAHFSHKRDDGLSAIGGQRDSSNVLHAVCSRCQSVWVGVGTGPEQLRPEFAAQLDMNLIGG